MSKINPKKRKLIALAVETMLDILDKIKNLNMFQNIITKYKKKTFFIILSLEIIILSKKC